MSKKANLRYVIAKTYFYNGGDITVFLHSDDGNLSYYWESNMEDILNFSNEGDAIEMVNKLINKVATYGLFNDSYHSIQKLIIIGDN